MSEDTRYFLALIVIVLICTVLTYIANKILENKRRRKRNKEQKQARRENSYYYAVELNKLFLSVLFR